MENLQSVGKYVNTQELKGGEEIKNRMSKTSFVSKQPKTETETSFGTIRNKTFVSVVSL
jgi:hypothetical protein